MPTKMPRIQVTLSEDAHRIISRMAHLQRSHRSTIIAEVINDLAPVLDGLLDTLEAAAQVRDENMRGVRDASLAAVDRMQVLVDDANNQFSLLDHLVRQAAEPKPPTSNTGVTNEVTHSKHGKRASGKKGAN